MPAPESIPERLKRYRLDRFVKTLPTLPRSHGDIRFDPSRDDVKQFYVHVPVQSLADLKLWMGYPNEQYAHPKQEGRPTPGVDPPVQTRHVGLTVGPADEAVVEAAEHHVLFGYVDDSLLADPFWSSIVNGLLQRVPRIPIVLAENLVVPDGTTVTLANTPTAFFDRVTVYGSGSIRFLSDCKLIANTFEVLPAPSVSDGPGTTTTHTKR